MKKVVLNAVSPTMIGGNEAVWKLRKISTSEASRMLKEVSEEVVSAVGHPATAEALSTLLGVRIPPNRVMVVLNKGDKAVIASLQGGRLPEGKVLNTREEVEALGFNFWLLEVIG